MIPLRDAEDVPFVELRTQGEPQMMRLTISHTDSREKQWRQ